MPTRYGRELIAQMNDFFVPAGAVALWGLGQMGVAVKGPDQKIIYIDPCLTDVVALKWPDPARGPTRAIEPPVLPSDVTNASVVICSHEHIDHTDCFTLAGIASASPNARFVATGWAQPELDLANIDQSRRIIPQLGQTIDLGVAKLNVVAAAHYQREHDPVKGERWLSLHLDWGTVNFFHGGDTIIHPGYIDAIRTLPMVDIAMLACNGRDAMRDGNDIVGNLYPNEAAWLAQTLGWDTVIAGHNDLFAGNRLPAEEVFGGMRRIAPRLRVHDLQPGEMYLYLR
ncbi:MAG: MBL fold metallo-hydrolase [Chloroflexales bacterium]|nr:MBL fold metallo-hydrolase [Chloroflexales bacterium]